jgi:hypothetical protein
MQHKPRDFRLLHRTEYNALSCKIAHQGVNGRATVKKFLKTKVLFGLQRKSNIHELISRNRQSKHYSTCFYAITYTRRDIIVAGFEHKETIVMCARQHRHDCEDIDKCDEGNMK